MATDAPTLLAPPRPAAANPDDLGIDRAFVVGLARIPFLALVWVALAWAGSAAVEQFGWHLAVGQAAVNAAPLAVICLGMLIAAAIDGYAFKVPNWCTLSLVVSGWYLGLLHDFGVFAVPGLSAGGYGGFASALALTALGFAFLFPALFIGGMGQGDVKMTMGFGSWLGAYFGLKLGALVLFWSFAIGVLIGGVFGLVIMARRRQYKKNLANFKAIGGDLSTLVTEGPAKANERAAARRPDWVRLPYGVPLCAGFLGYLWWILFVVK